MKLVLFLAVTFFCALGAYPQTGSLPGNVRNGKSPIILGDNARYTILTFNQFGGIVVKLDRYTGKTYQYAGERKWNLLPVRGNLPAQTSNSAPVYEILEESLLTFLLNTETGQTWVFHVKTWEPVEN